MHYFITGTAGFIGFTKLQDGVNAYVEWYVKACTKLLV
jgi:hypothetical protein